MNDLPVIVASVAAVLGAIGGLAAVVRVGSERDKTSAEATNTVVNILRQQIKDMDERLQELERHVSRFDEWADSVMDFIDRVTSDQPSEVHLEAAAIRRARPRRDA